MLLTADDFANRRHHANNAQRTLGTSVSLGVVPLINENDAVIPTRSGSVTNDRLAALVAPSDPCRCVDPAQRRRRSGTTEIRAQSPNGERGLDSIPMRVHGPEDLGRVIAGSGGALGTGGMASAHRCPALSADAGVLVLLAAASDARRLPLKDASVGTVFGGAGRAVDGPPILVRHAADSNGSLVIDDGAVAAVVSRRRSLLLKRRASSR